MFMRQRHNHGFSLLELLLALGILGIIAVFAVSLSHSSKNLARINETKNRMKEIKRAALDYYRGHRDLPEAAGANEVPVATSALNLEQKHRLDSWGRYFYYAKVNHATYPARTDITGVTVNNMAAAGVLISSGPDQTLESANASSPYGVAGDDIVLPISVNEQALAIGMQDLQILQSKAQAFEKMFAGIDNNAAGGIDEDGCVQAIGCVQAVLTNDPNCGAATLDVITSSYTFCSYTVGSPVELVVRFYQLGDATLLDPWLNPYLWGSFSTYPASDQRFHRFFSAGPDGVAGNEDDIIP